MRINSELRDKKHITQEELSNILHVDRSTISKWENGEALPRAEMLPEIAKALDCSIDDLLCI